MRVVQTSPRASVVSLTARDQDASTFSRVLDRLVAVTPGARGAALVDYEGETVDYAGCLAPFDVKITAAQWLIVLAEMSELSSLGNVGRLTVRARERAFHMRRLQDGYAVVLILHHRAAFAVSERALDEAIRSLSVEAGWPVSAREHQWFWVEVESEHAGRALRPRRLRVAGELQHVEVMGAVMGLAPREKGFRVRLRSGAEMMLVRERLGRWFADEHVE